MSAALKTEWTLGIDAGGTFTDVMAVGSDGRVVVRKVPSTPGNPVMGPLQGIESFLTALGSKETPVVSDVAHGTTVGLNALLQRRFPPVALVVTRGFRHVLEIARHTVPGPWGSIYSWVKPPRVVPLERIFEVDERVEADGRVSLDLAPDQMHALCEQLSEAGVGTIAVCLLNAYVEPQHEQQIRAVLEAHDPRWNICISSDIMPEFREYERMVTTATNAVLSPLIGAYMTRFSAGARERLGAALPVFIMRSVGGVVSAERAAAEPLRTALSGPAAGVLGMGRLAHAAGFNHAITFDMGGTSTDVAAVERGTPHVTTDAMIDIYPLRTPTIDIVTIGAGGGSLIGMGTGGRLQVGPESAGADPGPACYGSGGDQPTLTDANLLLGRIPDALVGGQMPLQRSLAERALGEVASKLGLDPVELAFSALEIGCHNMAGAVREVSVRRGLDIRRFALVAFGGAGPLHGSKLARIVGIRHVIVPPYPGLGSCEGLVNAPIRVDSVRTLARRTAAIDAGAMLSTYAQMQAQLVDELAANGLSHGDTYRSADVRYVGMGTELNVPVPAEADAASVVADAVAAFHAEHQRRYGFAYPDSDDVEIMSLRVEILAARAVRTAAARPGERSGSKPSGMRTAVLQLADGPVEYPVFWREDLPVGWRAEGPVFIDQYDTTTVVLAGQDVTVDAHDNLVITDHTHDAD